MSEVGHVREYQAGDEKAWLRCRVLAFLHTSYFDDVWQKKPVYGDPSVELVATHDQAVVGLIDLVVRNSLATIETIAVHPEMSRRGVGSALLDGAIARLPAAVAVLDAWTRDDETANAWYLGNGFVETFRYLHVYVGPDEVADAGLRAMLALSPVHAFLHADIEHEESLRARFKRVHVCRRYERELLDPR